MRPNPFPGIKRSKRCAMRLPTEVTAPKAARRVVHRDERFEP
jgi:hypothetical protein